MKVVIELNDHDLHKAIGQQLDAAVASFIQGRIDRIVNDVLEKRWVASKITLMMLSRVWFESI